MGSFATLVAEFTKRTIEDDVHDIEREAVARRPNVPQETNTLLTILDRSVTEVRPPMKADDYIRISNLPYMCEREEILCAMHEVTRKEKIDAVRRLVWGFGHKIHDLLQQDFLGLQRILIGDWICTKCNHSAYGTMPYKCEGCGAEDVVVDESAPRTGLEVSEGPLFKFGEITVRNDELNYGGHPDGELLVDGVRFLLEIKSIRGDLFYKLHEPYPEHIDQAQSYADLKGVEWIKFLYINKNGRSKSDFVKEFTMKLDRELVENRIKSKVRLIREGIRDSKLPERTMCITPTSVRAKKCKVRKFCFQGE